MKLNILNFHKWFHGFVPGWINVATEKCESHIRQAIELDEIVKITEELKLSSSAVDTNGFLLQMATFWHHLDWPMAFEAYAYVISLVEKICSCANLYIGEVFASLSPEDLRDDQGRFKASERVSPSNIDFCNYIKVLVHTCTTHITCPPLSYHSL